MVMLMEVRPPIEHMKMPDHSRSVDGVIAFGYRPVTVAIGNLQPTDCADGLVLNDI